MILSAYPSIGFFLPRLLASAFLCHSLLLTLSHSGEHTFEAVPHGSNSRPHMEHFLFLTLRLIMKILGEHAYKVMPSSEVIDFVMKLQQDEDAKYQN